MLLKIKLLCTVRELMKVCRQKVIFRADGVNLEMIPAVSFGCYDCIRVIFITVVCIDEVKGPCVSLILRFL